MANRIIELDTKVRTPQGDIVESEFRDNLSDLRLLVAKEYSTMLIGNKFFSNIIVIYYVTTIITYALK